MTKVINIKLGDKYDVYCGRAGHGNDGYFGNSHVIGFCKLCNRHHDREDCIEVFRQEFTARINYDKEYKKKIDELKDKILGCFCVPAPCHCEIYIDYHENPEKYLAQIKNRVIIAGSRHLYNYGLVAETIKQSGFKIDEIVCGCAKGIDTNGKIYGEKNDIPVKKFPAKWDDFTVKPCVIKTRYDGAKYNSWAGHIRNKEMAKYATHLILIWDGKSTGSQSMLKLAKEHNLIIHEKVVNG
jgi:hypothetical protein